MSANNNTITVCVHMSGCYCSVCMYSQFSTNGDEKCRQVIGAVWLVGGSEFKEHSHKGEVGESITTAKNIIYVVCMYVGMYMAYIPFKKEL